MMAKQSWNSSPEMEIDQDKSYTAVVKTSEGDITLELFSQDAPKTVNNFVFLARQGYYGDVIFHRVIKGFMIQTGDPTGTGTGGPGYKFADEPVRRQYTKGTVAMANSGPNTNGSQFFIVHGATVALPPNYTIFGQVTDGLDVVDAIAGTPTKPGGEGSKPQNPPRIEAVEIREA
jgi:cyclophilin family peptidyl-prolyl cis-trans isomerase